jgi:hypothetical protein
MVCVKWRKKKCIREKKTTPVRGLYPHEVRVIEEHMYGIGIRDCIARARQELEKVWSDVPTGLMTSNPVATIKVN